MCRFYQVCFSLCVFLGWVDFAQAAFPIEKFKFTDPQDIVFDSNGNMFVSDSFTCVIYRLSPMDAAGYFFYVKRPFAGDEGHCDRVDGIGQNAHLDRPLGMTVDAANNLYVVDGVISELDKRKNVFVLRKISPSAEVTTLRFLVDDPDLLGYEYRMIDFEMTSSGSLYGSVLATRAGNHADLVVELNLTHLTAKIFAGAAGCGETMLPGTGKNACIGHGLHRYPALYSVAGITKDNADTLYLAHGSSILEIDTHARVTLLAGTPDGTYGFRDGAARSAALMTYSSGVIYHKNRVLFMDNDHPLSISPSSAVIRDYDFLTDNVETLVGDKANLAGYADGVGASAVFGRMMSVGIAVDKREKIYVADRENQVLRVIDSSGPAPETSTLKGFYVPFYPF